MDSSESTPSTPAPDDKWVWVKPVWKASAVTAVCVSVVVGAIKLDNAKIFKVLPGAIAASISCSNQDW